ncbi:Putative uncharacterized protein [Moritella viscosa]|uniref:AAA family ATPase n=1 Tax=Moritella viscosa TaxID=80854 RepID=UPI000910F4E7|nr:AAA family ATPase [Moritella viscosa]SGY93154.1 Putative uncharacterized protein [Moritella viscosa]
MLERIHYIKSTGLLNNVIPPSFGFKKANLIYADNGRGKSTLASIFQSCSTNTPSLITNRKTISSTVNQEIRFQFSQNQISHFTNGNWSNHRDYLSVFDVDFVNNNVYSGTKVSSEHRKNLLTFALGSSAVSAQTAYNTADAATKISGPTLREKTAVLNALASPLKIAKFIALGSIPDIDSKILNLEQDIINATNNDQIQSKATLSFITLPVINVAPILSVLKTSLSDIDTEAETKVKEHIEHHVQPGFENWLSRGQDFSSDDSNCPFCYQDITGLDLINSYKTYFNSEYIELKKSVHSLGTSVNSVLNDNLISETALKVQSINTAIQSWTEYTPMSEISFDCDIADDLFSSIKDYLDSLVETKQSDLLTNCLNSNVENEIEVKIQSFLELFNTLNQQIKLADDAIIDYKSRLLSANITTLTDQKKNLEKVKLRFESQSTQAISEYDLAKSSDKIAKATKISCKTVLDSRMKTVLTTYTTKINELLISFGASFKLPVIDFNYQGGLTSDYALEVRGQNVSLNNSQNGFDTVLSEADKRTLAFSFFIASLELEPNLANKIVVIDDPMCSLDLNRRQQTRTVLKRIYASCKQLIILAHDPHFLRNLRDDLLRENGVTDNDLQFIKLKAIRHQFTDFAALDLDLECESTYFKHHRLLEEFLDGEHTNSTEVAKSIRPMLEGYLHRRFPNLIPKGQLFGQIVGAINTSDSTNPLYHAKNITSELNDINSYAGKFHHDANPACDSEIVIDTELRTFVVRSLLIVHKSA